MKRSFRYIGIAAVMAVFFAACDSVNVEPEPGLSRFSGVWEGTVQYQRAGACAINENEFPFAMHWVVAENGSITISAHEDGGDAWNDVWTGQIDDELNVVMEKRTVIMCNEREENLAVGFESRITQANGNNRLILEADELWCATPQGAGCAFVSRYNLTQRR